MYIPVVARPLVGFMLLHQGNQLLCGPSLRLEVIVVGGRSSSIHLQIHNHISDNSRTTVPGMWAYHKIDGAATTQDMGTGDNRSSAIEPP